MKKFIDKESGRVVTLLNVDEAKKILEMYINYCLGKREVKIGRLNLVNYLGDFVKYATNKDMAKFYDVLMKEKEAFGFSKSDLKSYESLVAFFEIYSGIEKGEFDIINVSNYIMEAINKKKLIDQKINDSSDLNFEEKLNHIFFNKDFDLSVLAQDACKKWEELLNKKIGESPDGIDVSLKDEIAYQDLLAFCDGEDFQTEVKTPENVTQHEEKKVEPIVVEHNAIKEEKKDNNVKVQPVAASKKEEIEVSVPLEETKVELKKEEVKEVAKEEIKEEKKPEENFGPIIVNAINDKEEKDKQDKKHDNEQDEIIIGSSSIREATQDVSLREAAGFFNDAIDDISKNNQNTNSGTSNNNSGSSDDSDFFGGYGTLRD